MTHLWWCSRYSCCTCHPFLSYPATGFGNLFVAGSNTNNQLGLAAEFKELSSISDFLPCAALQGERVIQISRDIVLTDSGKVYCFGRLRTPMLNFTSTLGGPDGPFELDVQEHRIVDVSAAKNHVLLRNGLALCDVPFPSPLWTGAFFVFCCFLPPNSYLGGWEFLY